MMLCEEPIEESGSGATDVEVAGWGGSEADPDLSQAKFLREEVEDRGLKIEDSDPQFSILYLQSSGSVRSGSSGQCAFGRSQGCIVVWMIAHFLDVLDVSDGVTAIHDEDRSAINP